MVDPFVIVAPFLLLPVIALLRFIGCSSFSEAPTAAVVIKITPESADLGPGQSKQFTAQADGIMTTAVTWSGNAPAGLYTAPDPHLAGVMTATVTATSTAATNSSGSATVNLKSVTVVVTPPVVALSQGETQTFTANVQPTSDQNVTWTNAPNGVFTAPSPYVLGAAPVTITATANADPAAKGTATINLTGDGARFVGSDASTRGTWKGIYGSAGWALAKTPNIVNRPPFVSVLNLPPPASVFTYADPTVDSRGLQRPPMFLDRFAAVWADSAAVQLGIEFADLLTHRIVIYCVDWDTVGRAEKIEILNSSVPPAVLDTRSLTAFNGGIYMIWDVSGKVVLRATKTAGANAVISGIFFE
jgi:nitrogen fixation protein FixH